MTTTLAHPALTPESARARGRRTPSRTVSEGGLLTAVVAGAAAVLELWWHDTTILAGLGEWLTAAGTAHRSARRLRGRGHPAADEQGPVDRSRARLGHVGTPWAAGTRSACWWLTQP